MKIILTKITSASCDCLMTKPTIFFVYEKSDERVRVRTSQRGKAAFSNQNEACIPPKTTGTRYLYFVPGTSTVPYSVSLCMPHAACLCLSGSRASSIVDRMDSLP